MSRRSDVQRLVYEYNRRLQRLKERQARMGLNTPPEVLTEIEDIEATLENLKADLQALPDDESDLPPLPLTDPASPQPVQDNSIQLNRTTVQGDVVSGGKKTVDTGGAPYLENTTIETGGGNVEIFGKKTVLIISVPLIILVLVILVSTVNLADAIHRARGTILAPIWPLPVPTATPASAMPDNFFNIGVAQLPELMPDGDLQVTEASREFTDFLYTVIEKTGNQPGLAAQLRGPELIGVVPGNNFAARAEVAEGVSKKHNANFLIFGLIIPTGPGSYQAELEFYLSHRGFDYGSEITGPEAVNRYIEFTLPLDSPDTQNQLSTRMQILQHVVEGLHHFYFGDYEQAWAKFYQASIANRNSGLDDLPVLHLLMGSAKLQLYGPKIPEDRRVDLLNQAEAEFGQAYNLNPDYARSYLGLGIVMFQQATQISPPDEAKLNEAVNWYRRSAEAPGQSANIREKAEFGLGQAHLAGFMAGLPNWSGEQALQSFDQVIEAYNSTRSEALAEMAGHSHAYKGWITGNEGDWSRMADEFYAAITTLSSLPAPPNDWLALYWSYAGQAEEELENPSVARQAYAQAVSLGEQVAEPGAFSPEQLEQWRADLTRLEEGTP